MPEYKNIWFADTSEPMLVEAISQKQAVSVGDELEKLKYNTSIICTSTAQVAEAFPNPVQGDRVYRADLGVEQMYFERYNSSLNPYGKNSPGWYAVSPGLVPIYPTGFTSDGTTAATANALGKVTFKGAKNVTLPNVFSSEFRNYKVVVNLHTTSAGTYSNLRYVSNGVVQGTALYLRTILASEVATANPPPGVSGPSTGIEIQTSSIFRNSVSETIIFGPYLGSYPKTFSSGTCGALTTNNRVSMTSTVYNSASTVMNGITFYSNQTATMDGTIQVYGYR